MQLFPPGSAWSNVISFLDGMDMELLACGVCSASWKLNLFGVWRMHKDRHDRFGVVEKKKHSYNF